MASKPNLYGLGISILSSHIDMGPSLEDLRKDTSGTEDLLCDEEQNQARGVKCKPNGFEVAEAAQALLDEIDLEDAPN